jgi:hypothetical protein
LPNDPPRNGTPDGIKENDLHMPGTARSNEGHSESAVFSAVNSSEADAVTNTAARFEDKNPSSSTATLQTTSGNPSQQSSDAEPSILIGGVPGKYEAKAIMTGVGKKYSVLAGSTINPTEADSLTYGAKKLRQKLQDDLVIVEYKFVKDYVFNSPTAATG